jgi:hypothetical protein
LHRLLDHLREGDTVVVWKLDRLSRSLKDVPHIMERIGNAGAGFRSITENSPESRCEKEPPACWHGHLFCLRHVADKTQSGHPPTASATWPYRSGWLGTRLNRIANRCRFTHTVAGGSSVCNHLIGEILIFDTQ